MAVPLLLEAAGHPLRWAILRELAHSDRRVRELTAALGEQQNLVSYHLGRLRANGLVTARRSAFDGRDAYYRLDLARCQALLADTGAALHPALRLLSPPAPAPAGRPRLLFLCTGNSARSQMAEALVGAIAPGGAEALSAGSRPKPVHPEAIRAMRERDIDISGAQSKHLAVFAGERFDHVVSLCDRVREVCPEFPGSPDTVHWSIPEPDDRAAFARVADELTERIRFFLHVLALRPTTPERN
jgi:ArsR family transcriptional regulator, arsenate/arsenite/antimonite-responsive transcriptional repressor / arsenate reductase (thioredoxin)